MKQYTYKPKGVCSTQIDYELDDDGRIYNLRFTGGCNGNLQGISQLVVGQKIDDVVRKIDGIRCGAKNTSCPDQLCRALEQLKKQPLEP